MLYRMMMLTFPHLIIFTVFSSFPLIVGYDLQNKISAGIDQSAVDGEQYIKSIIHGEKVSEKPGILMFTAPYKLCEGGCKDESDQGDIVLGFPLYIGKRGQKAFKNIFHKDYNEMHKNNPNAPFTKRTTRATTTTTTPTTTPSTTTVTSTCKIITIIQIVTTEPPPTTLMPTPCPFVPFGMCLKKIKQKYNLTKLKFPTEDDMPEVTTKTINLNEQEELDYFDHLINFVTKNKTNNTVSQPVVRELNPELSSDFDSSDELIVSSENIGKTTEKQSNNINTFNTVIQTISQTSAVEPETKPKERNIQQIPEANLKTHQDADFSSLIGTVDTTPNIILEISTTQRTTEETTIDTTNDMANTIGIGLNKNEVSIVRNGDYHRRGLLLQRDISDNFVSRHKTFNSKYVERYPYRQLY